MIILTQYRDKIITICDYDSITLGNGNSGKIYYTHDNVHILIGEYQSGYIAKAVIYDIYNAYGLSPKYCMPTIGEAKYLKPCAL